MFSLVSKYTIIRMLLQLAVENEWNRSLIDVGNNFVNAPLKEDICVQQTEGFWAEGREDVVYRMDKALYGLRQTSKQWNVYLGKFLISMV